jgi:hypothetical protein
VVPPQQEPTSALAVPISQPEAVVAVPSPPAESPQAPVEEKPVKHPGKRKEPTKKEKKTEEEA